MSDKDEENETCSALKAVSLLFQSSPGRLVSLAEELSWFWLLILYLSTQPIYLKILRPTLLCQLPVCCFRASPRRLVQSCTADRSPFGQNFGKYSKIVSTVEGFASLLYQHFRFRLVEDTFVITQSGAGKSQTILWPALALAERLRYVNWSRVHVSECPMNFSLALGAVHKWRHHPPPPPLVIMSSFGYPPPLL